MENSGGCKRAADKPIPSPFIWRPPAYDNRRRRRRPPDQMDSFSTSRVRAPLKRGLRTPAQLGVVAARLFGPQPNTSRVLPCGSNGSTSSNGSAFYDQLYLDQCHEWFTRETRAGKTPKPQPVSMSSIIDTRQKPLRKKSVHSKPRMKAKRLTKCLHLPSLPSDGPSDAVCRSTLSVEPPSPVAVPGCVACNANMNSEIKSDNFFKRLSNNVLICSVHRFITHWMLDFKSAKQAAGKEVTDFEAVWKPEDEEVQADLLAPFSVTEDRRVVAGVDRFGTDAWETILGEYEFAKFRKPEDLRSRWQQIQRV